MSNISSESCCASFNGFYYILMVFLAPPAGFLERRACILALRFALEAGGEAALAAARGFAVAGLADTTGFFTGDLAATACFGAGLATLA